MAIYALRLDMEGKWAPIVYNSLEEGLGRYGWSYMQDNAGNPLGDADLWRLRDQVVNQGWHTLTADEQDRYQVFLLNLNLGDWVVYINTPEWGRCTATQVAEGYRWKYENTDS